MKQIFSLLLFGIIALFAGCKKTATKNAATVSVAMEQCVQKLYGADNLSLCLDELVEDSRCPTNANCMWQGVARLRFSMQLQNQSYSFVLSTSNVQSFRTDTTIQNYRISLRQVTPYPGKASPEKPVADVLITKL
jgi:hypothetical protein